MTKSTGVGRGGKREGAGRPAGSAAQQVIARERSLIAKYEKLAAETPAVRLKLCKEILAEHANNFHSLAAIYHPLNPDGSARAEGNWDKFVQFATLAVDAASKGAPYESPKFAAIAIASVPPSSREAQLGELSPVQRIDTMLRDISKRMRQGGMVIDHEPSGDGHAKPGALG